MLKAKIKPHGGVHPDGHKHLTSQSAIKPIKLPRRLIVSLKQHTGAAAIPVVEIGTRVIGNQLLARSNGRASSPIHAPLAGEVTEINLEKQTITIKVDQTSQQSSKSLMRYEELPERDALLSLIEQAGIVGMGGAMFPAADKIRMSLRYPIETLIINGSECEPYLTVDDRLMQEQGEQLIGGIRYLKQITKAKQVYIGIEDNKPDALAVLDALCELEPNMDVVALPALYPMGSAKQMIEAVTGMQIPQGKRSTEMGVLVQNVGTCIAIFNAIRFEKPLTHRVVTVSGGAIEQPANLMVPIGTPISELIEQCGGLKEDAARIVLGGPMMGRAVSDIHEPITKGTSGLLLLTKDELPNPHASACVRCGRCMDVCPMSLPPLDMVVELKIDNLESAQKMGLDECLLCGSCSYVCPAAIPLTKYFDWGQQELNRQWRMEQKTKLTCTNSAAHRERMEREAAEREAAKAAKQQSRRPSRRTATQEDAS
ncbi:electron transport complex subunit RsxC [Tolumonas lignilytica]|jgi:electron transport complex, RnfABCDGE type, C subunit|uniref:electron transport complex subunit RsxC n=1 Tax=Tolumonas lignilytica TaxID=1283284 RepID=UPI000463C577|nr:electron transport complex subunit RsxC [Tolumonas lignilytica]